MEKDKKRMCTGRRLSVGSRKTKKSDGKVASTTVPP